MYSFFLKSFLIFCLLTLPALSKNYNDIIINGNKRISNETIKVFSGIKDNEILDENSYPIYYDSHHMNIKGSAILDPVFKEMISSLQTSRSL